MKKTIIFALTFLLLMGCRHHRAVSPRLVELDSLIAIAPDSAAALLAAIPADSLTAPENRAYHALLLTQAKYKAYIPATSDSDINIAVDYFVAKNDGNYDRRIRSLIYKGCVMTELNHPDSAMYWFKSAETAASPDDHANLGFIKYKIGVLFMDELEMGTTTINYLNTALQHFNYTNDTIFQLACLIRLGSIECLNKKSDKKLKEAQQLAIEFGENDYVIHTLEHMSIQALQGNQYQQAKELSMNAILQGDSSVACYSYVVMSYCGLGYADSALFYLRLMPKPKNMVDSMTYHRAHAELARTLNNMEDYVFHNDLAGRISDTIFFESQQAEIKEIEQKYENQVLLEQVKSSRIRLWLISALAVLLFLLVGIAFAFWQKRKKLDAVTKQNEINKLYLELKEISQRSESLSQQNKELSQENEELQALAKKVQQTESDLSTDKDYADLENERFKEKQLSKSLEYIAGLLHTFIQQSHELKPSEFMEKFRKGFLETPNGGEVDFWYTLRVQADQVHSGAVEKLLAEHPDLNETFIRVLCMSALGFSTEMMATCLQHKSDYIKTLKNRLKKKLDINCSIPDYLKQLGETR